MVGSGRTESIDLLRGFIMIFMALDHTSAMVGRVHFTEMWGVAPAAYPDLAWWFTRFVSHLCAPGFFFLMGMSVVLFAQKRMEKEWSPKQIRRYFLKRGSLILVLMFFLEFPAWGLGFSFDQTNSGASFDMPGSGEFGVPSTVLYGLGSCLIISGLLWRLGKGWLLGITVASFLLSGLYIHFSDPTQGFYFWEHLLLVPGISQGVMVIYPIIPWLGVTTFGMLWARLYLERGESLFRLSWQVGAVFLVAAIGLRALHFGNLGQEGYQGWISFFTLVKYPPSLIFFLLTCGTNLLLLSIFHRLGGRAWLGPVKLFGQTAMFFYLAHLYLYAVLGIPFPLGAGIWVMYLVWILALIPLYYLCRWFLGFKQTRSLESIWRMI